MVTVKVSSGGCVVIPAKLREKYNLKPGDSVRFVENGDIGFLVPATASYITHAGGFLKGAPSLTEALLREHQKERTRGR